MKNLFKIIVVCVFLLCCVKNSFSQTITLPQNLNQGVIRIAEPGQLADTLSLWGAVGRPGRYLVSRSTNLTELISIARGPVGLRANRRSSWGSVELDVYISRYNERLDEYQVDVFNVKLNEPFPAAMKNYPLYNGDVITVKADRKASFRDYFSIIAPIITLGFTTYLFIDGLK